jgi:hypothetical protein
MKTGFQVQPIKRNHQYPDTPSFKTGTKPRSIMVAVLGIAVCSVTVSIVPASGPVLVAVLTTWGRLLSGLLDDVRTGDHWDGLCHPGLSLEVGLLRVRSGALVEGYLVGIVGASADWKSLYTTRVLLWEGGWTLVRVGIGRTASLVWRSCTVAVGGLIDWDRHTGGSLVGRATRRDYHRTRVERD